MTTGKDCLHKWLWSPSHTCRSILSDISSLKRAQRKLKNSLRECVALKGQPHDAKEQLNIMDSCALSHILFFIFGNST